MPDESGKDETEKSQPSVGSIDLSSLIELPPKPDSEPASEPALAPGSEAAAPGGDSEPVHFESLEDFSHETPAPPVEEPASAGIDLPQPPEPLPAVSEEPGIDSIKKFSENIAASQPEAASTFPFTLKIEGNLPPADTEKLLSVLTRENVGIREVDLEPQIAEGKILIPRISEYAGVLLIQALRGIPAKISFGPSDEIFSTPETREEPAPDLSSDWNKSDPPGLEGLAQIPVTNGGTLPQFEKISAIETIVASGLLSTRSVETAVSEEYEVLIEALMRELRFKAHRRGANGIVALQVQLTPLTLPTDYRVTVTGTAVLGA